MTAAEMRLRSNLLSGDDIGDASANEMIQVDDDFERLHVTNSDSELDEDIGRVVENREAKRQKVNDLMYNDSDNEDEQRSPLKPSKDKRSKKSGQKINIFDMVKNSGDNDKEANNVYDENEMEINSEDIRSRIAQLDDSDTSDVEQTAKAVKQPRKRIAIVDSDSEDDDVQMIGNSVENDAEIVLPNADMEPNSEDFSSQAIQSRLAALEDSDSDTELAIGKQTIENKRHSNKRERSASGDETLNDGQALVSQNKKKAKKLLIEDEDDE